MNLFFPGNPFRIIFFFRQQCLSKFLFSSAKRFIWKGFPGRKKNQFGNYFPPPPIINDCPLICPLKRARWFCVVPSVPIIIITVALSLCDPPCKSSGLGPRDSIVFFLYSICRDKLTYETEFKDTRYTWC